MTKRFRLFIVVLLLAVSAWFLYPTFTWYFLTPPETQRLASGSLEQIRDYSVLQAKTRLKALQDLEAQSPGISLPAEYDYLLPVVKRNYELAKMTPPATWTVKDVFKAFTTDKDFLYQLEEHFRTGIIAVKTSKAGIMQLGLDLSGGMSVVISADLEAFEKKKGTPLTDADRDDAISRAIEVLKSRIDVFGVSEPVIKREAGGSKIFVELPGDVDPERVNSFLRGKGSLSLNIVDDEATAAVSQWLAANPGSVDPLTNLVVGEIPAEVLGAGLELRNYYKKDRFSVDQFVSRIVVKTEAKFLLDGQHITTAATERDPVSNQPLVTFALDSEGADLFFKMTQDNTGKSMAVVLDGKVRAYARISQAISGGRVQVSGFDTKDAADLKTTLKTGAMPVNLIVESSTNIGSSLGSDAVNSGVNSILYACSSWCRSLVCWGRP